MSLETPDPTHPTIGTDLGTLVPGLASAFRGSVNAYVGGVEDKTQYIQFYVEKINSSAGFGWISGGTVAAGSGLSVTVDAYEAVVGNYIQCTTQGTVGGLAANDTNYLYLRQDGVWTTNVAGTVPASGDGHGAALKWGYAVTDGTAVTSVSNTRAQFRVSGGCPYLYVAASDCPTELAANAWATCGGTADNVTIQAAIDAIAATTGVGDGGIVQLSPGKFYITDTINLKPGVDVRGAGMLRTWVQMGTGLYKNIFQLIGTPVASGTAESGTNTTLVDDDATWTANAYAGKYVVMNHGAGAGQVALISANDGTALTMGSVAVAPSTDTKYEIYPQPAAYTVGLSGMAMSWATTTPYSGTITSGTVDAIWQATHTWDVNALQNGMVCMLVGTAALQTRRIESNTAGTAIVADPFTTTPVAGDRFAIGGCGVVVWNQYLRKLWLRDLYISPQVHGVALTTRFPEFQIDDMQIIAGIYGCGIVLEAPSWGRTGLLGIDDIGGRISNSNLWTERYGNVRIRPYVYNISVLGNHFTSTDRYGAGVIIDGGAGHIVANNNFCAADSLTTTESGTASAGASTTLTDDTKSWTADYYKEFTVQIVAGTGDGQRRIITTNDGTALTVTHAWDTNPDDTSEYEIHTRSHAGIKINAGYAITATGNRMLCQQTDMVNGIYNVAGSAIIATGNVVTGETDNGYEGILDLNSQVTDAGNLVHTI